MYPLNRTHPPKNRKQHYTSRLSGCAAVTLNLEVLEDRCLLNGALGATSPPPTFNQAAIALFSDGVKLGEGLVNQFVFRFDQNTAYPAPLADINADIAFNSQFVGPSAPFFVLAAEMVGAQIQFQTQSVILQSDF